MVYTTLKIQEETKKRLTDFGKKSETYDELINRILGLAESVTE